MLELLPSSCEWIEDETGELCGKTPASHQGLLFVPNRTSIISIRYVCEVHALEYGPSSWRVDSRTDLADAGEDGDSTHEFSW